MLIHVEVSSKIPSTCTGVIKTKQQVINFVKCFCYWEYAIFGICHKNMDILKGVT